MALKNADAAAKKRLDEMARNAAGANTSGGKKAAVDAKFGGGGTSERSAYNRLYHLAQQSVQEQARLKAQAASAQQQRQPTASMRQGAKQTSTAESRLSQRRFEATSFPSYKLRGEAIAAQQRADDDTLDRKIELTLERLQTTLPKKETSAGMVNNPEYQALYDALIGYQAQKKTAEQEAKDAADVYNSASGMDAKKIAGLYVAPYFKKGTNISDATALLDEYLTYQDAMQNGVVGAGDKWKTARAALIGAGLSEDSIDEAADIWRRASNSEAMSLSNQSWAEATREHPILASALSVPLSITSGLGFLDLATQKIGNPDKSIDFNTGTMRAAGAGTTIRETAVEDMNSLESFLYQTGMSMADSTAIAALSQLGVPGASVLLSGSAATSAAREAKERGGTDAQALGYGLAAGIAEGLFETVSLEMLTKNAIGRLGRQAAEQAGTQRILTLLKSAGIQAATEGSEEVFTTIANTISDAVIMGDKSEYAQNKQLYMDAGMSKGEAEKKAAEDWLTGILGDFLGGALSGGIMGGAGTAISSSVQGRNEQRMSALQAAAAESQVQQETPQDILQRVAMESVQEQPAPEQTTRTNAAQVGTSQELLRVEPETGQDANQAAQENQSAENQTALERFANQVVSEDREKQQKIADQFGATLGVNGAESFSREYKESDGSLPAEEAFEGYRALYKSALSGAEMSESGKNAAAKLPQDMARAALIAGQQDAARARNAKYFGREESLVRDDNFKKAHLSSRTARVLEAVGRATGTQIRFAENVTDSDGNEANASYDGGVITISLNAENPVSAALSHEVVHRIREASPDAFEALARYVTDNMDALGMKLRRKQTELVYNTDNVSDITEEIVADAFGTMSGMTDVLNRFAVDERSAAQKIADVLHDIVNAVKRILSNQNIKLSQYEQESFASLLKDSETMAGVFDTALRKTADTIAENGAKPDEAVQAEDTVHYDDVRYSRRVTDKDVLDFLNEQKAIKTYKTMQLVDGKLYPPMAARVDGKFEDSSVLGEWEMAVERPDLVKDGKFKLDKGKGQGSIKAAYNPYMHSSNLVINDQFSGAYTRDNLVTVECEVPASEATSGYHAEGAKDSVGWHSWHTGTVAGQIRRARGIERRVFLSRWIKPVRIMSNAEVAGMYKELIGDSSVSVPDNVVTPDLLNELKKAGVAISESGRLKKTAAQRNKGENLTEAQIHQRVVENKPVNASDAVKHSRKYNTEYMDAAEKKNKKTGFVTDETMKQARTARQAIADIFNDPDLQDSLGLPPDIIGNTYIPNGSYSGTEENSTVCIRSIAADALMDAVAEYLGRPLTVEDTITISQELFNFTDKPECLYCYVAMDRKAYREFLGSYLKQRDDVFEDIKNGMSEDEAYQKFLNGRKDTGPMQKRFSMWVSLYKQGKPRIDANDLASAANQEKAIERDKSLTAQINDARKYAQSASWAKKRLSYAAYNNHILKWAQSRIDNLNSNYGLRMYSFSDFSPAFILENMQMITDAAARGLKVLAYTKELDFVRIFAETGMNINISAFGYDDKVTGGVAQDGMQGADWGPAKELRKQYDNVGITFVATNDAQVEWALAQDWIDVVIPFHLVRTGEKVASYFGWHNYKDVQDDIKTKEFDNATDKRHILPPDHQNNKELYLEACRRNHLTPRFEKWVDNENYMKLVNETRRSEAETPTVQPVFDVDAAKESISTMIKRGGYYKPIGGDIEGMQDIAAEIGEKIEPKKKLSRKASDYESALEELKADTQFSQELDIDRLSKENARLKARVERLKGEMKKTKEKTVRKADVDKLARRIVKEYSSTVSASEISEELKAIGDSIVQGGEHMTYEALMDSLMPIADYVVKNARVLNDQLYQEYKELRDSLRTTRMTLSEAYRNDLAGYESYNDFRKHYRGKLLLTNDGIPVDVKYQELSSQYPEYFSADILHPADQLTRIADVLDSLTPVYENPNSIAFEAAANEAANEMLDTLIGEDVRQTAPTYADRHAKRLQETRARYQRELARVRESRDEKIKKLKERHKTQESEAIEKRRASELRGKLLKHTEELSRRLLRPTDTKHIPEALRSSVASVLESINLESKRAPNRSQRFAKLKEVYKSIAGETVIDPSLLGGDGQTGLLDQIVAMGDKPISDMNSSELNVIWNAVRSVEASVQNANRMLTQGKFRATSEWAQRFKTDTDSRKNKRGSRITIDLEDPYTFFSHYGESGKAVYRMLRNAQDDARVKLDRIIEDVQNIVDPKTVKNAQRTRHEFTLASGEHLTLTTGQIMGLYNLSQRQQAQGHLLKGGIVQPEIKRSGGKPKIERGTRLVALTEKDLTSFFSVLSGEEKNTARSLQSITATTLSKWGNEASMKAYGYKKFTGTDYWPIHSAGEVLQSSTDRSGSNVRSIANIGLAKAVIPGANNAIDVYDVFDDFAQHTADMIDYATWLLPMEDANRLFNYRYKDESGRTTGTIKGILDENGGKGAQQYWSKLMENIQNGVRVETDAMSTVVNKMYGNVKAAAVGANIRVIAQQPTAFVRAAAVLDPLNMARGIVKGVTKGDGWEKAKRYAPIARIKDAGSFDQSNFKSVSSELYESGTVLSKLSDKAGSPAAAADAVTWGRLWNACEWQVFRENRSIAPGSEAFYGKTAELFTDMVDQTQVVDGILQRSQVMRSGNSITKQATSFMGEPLKSLNVLLRSWDKLRYETNSTKKKAAAKAFARAAAALTATDLVNAAVQSLIDAIRDDDEDKKYWERWLTAFSGISGDEETVSETIKNVLMKGNVADNMNPLGRIPFANDIWSLIQGYSVDRMDMSAVSDFIDAASTFAKNIGGDGRYTQAYAAKQLLAAASKVFGVSVFNVTRDAWGIARTAAVETGDVWAQYQMEKAIYNISSESNKNRYMDILYRALESGDTELYLKIAAELIDDEPNGVNGKSIESAMRSRFEKHKAENSSYKLPAGMEEIIRIVPAYQEDEPETYDVSNLSAAAYQSYMEQRAANYEQAVGDVLELPYFKSLDEAAQAKVYGYIDKLTHSYALADAADGEYTITTNWIADAAGAEAKGISTAKYALFHLAYVSLTSDKDKDGKTIKGRAKSDKVEDWINKQGFTEPQKKYLWETVYSEKTNPF